MITPDNQHKKEQLAPDRLRPSLAPGLEEQLDTLTTLWREHYQLSEAELAYFRQFFFQVLSERNQRALEVASEANLEAVNIANSLFPIPPFLIQCIDGRTLSVLLHGGTGGLGGSLRLPAGDMSEFVPATNGKTILLPDSNFAHRLDDLFQNYDSVAQILDSHMGCRARELSENNLGRHPNDGGLYTDVLRKLGMAHAMTSYTEKHHPGKKIVPIQISFDPHNGYMYMGLEKPTSLAAAQMANQQFTENVLTDLVANGEVISTATLAEHLDSLFQEYTFTLDWVNDYAHSAQQFWQNMQAMQASALPIINAKLQSAYPELNSEDSEFKERAQLLLANSYSGFLNNIHHYDYAAHNERVIVVSRGGYSPFPTPSFAISSKHETRVQLPNSVALAATIIQGNRAGGRDPLPKEVYESTAEYQAAPVPMIINEVVDTVLPPEAWALLDEIDFNKLPSPGWFYTPPEEFGRWLSQKYPLLPNTLTEALKALLQNIQILHSPDQPTVPSVINGKLLIMACVVDKYRRPRAIIPFTMSGYSSDLPVPNFIN